MVTALVTGVKRFVLILPTFLLGVGYPIVARRKDKLEEVSRNVADKYGVKFVSLTWTFRFDAAVKPTI